MGNVNLQLEFGGKPDLLLSNIGKTILQLKFSGKLFPTLSLAPTKSRLVSNGNIAVDNTTRSHKRIRERSY